MKLCFLVAAWLVHASLFSLTNSLQDLETEMAKMSEKMLSTVTKAFSRPQSRQKREPGAVSLDDASGVYHVVSIRPVSHLCYPAVKMLFIDVLNTTYAVCVAAPTLDTPAEIIVGYYKEHSWMPIKSWFVRNVVDVAAFNVDSFLYVLAADTEKNVGSELMKIDLRTNYGFVEYEVHGHYATGIALWKMKNTGKVNLAIANSNGYKDAEDMRSAVHIYEWMGTYFDQNSSLIAYDVKDIEPFHIYGTTYLAIANFRRGRNIPQVDSEIFRFDVDQKKWISYQKITTHGAMDWEFFALGTSLGQEFFLAVANKGHGESDAKSMIYKFVDDKFVPFQCLLTTRATSISTFSRDSLFILAVANENDAVHIYQYDGWRFVKSGVQWTAGAMADGVVNLNFHKIVRNGEEALILSVGNPRHPYNPSIFEIGFVYQNPLNEWYNQGTEWCLNLLEKLGKTDLANFVGFNDVIFTDQPNITINGDVIFEKGFVSDSLRTSKFTDISTEEVFDYNLISKLESLQNRLDGIKQKLEGLSGVLSKSMKVDGDQTILSNLEFQDATFRCKDQSCHFKNINTETLNGERIADWANRVVFTDEEQNINGTLMAKEISATNMHVLGSIDGVKIENLVTKSGSHLITAYKTLNNTITTEDMNVGGTIDGLEISSERILLTTGNQTISGHKYFQNINTTWLKAGIVNKKDLNEFYKDIVLKGRSYDITGIKTFKDVTVDQLTMNPGSTINRVDLAQLWDKALWIDGKQEVDADITFADVVLQKNLDASLGINGVQIPGRKIVDITKPMTFTVPQTFINSTHMESLTVLKSLNGINLVTVADGSLNLDLLLKSGEQVVSGSKTFHTIHLDADSDVKGYVDGVDLSELQKTVLRKNTSVVTDGTWIFDKLSIKGPLTVKGNINNANLTEIYEKALKLNDPEIPDIVFNTEIEVEDLESRNINDIDILEDFVLVNKHQNITGRKHFTDVILEESSLVLGLVNNINMSFLNDVLMVIGNQHIKSKIFNRNVVINNLTVEDTINNIPVKDIVTLQGGKIFGQRTLENVTFSFIDAKNIEVTGKVNGIDINEMIEDTMIYSDPQNVTGTKNILGIIHMLNDSNLQTNDFNGTDFSALWADAVFVDVEQEIYGTVEFKNNVIFHNLSFSGTIDGVSDWEIKNWMLKDKPQVVEGSSLFSNGFKAKDLNLRTVNGLDLKKLESNIVKLNEPTEVKGSVIFDKSLSVTGNVGITGKIQGVKLYDDAVLKHENVYIPGEKTFSQDIIIDGPLTVDGLINNINIEDFCNKAFVKDRDINVTRLVIKGDVVMNEGTVGGSLSGIELQQLKEMVVRDDGSTIKFSGLKTFGDITFEGPVEIRGKFGSINVNELARNYMSLTRDQEIPGRIEFEDVKFEGSLSVTSLNTADGRINNINLQEINDRILKTIGTQNVTATYYTDEVHFQSDVFVAGKVNGLDLPTGVMRHDHTNYIQSPKIFQQPLIVLENLTMESGKTLQEVDVSEWFAKAVLVEGEFTINGQKTFNELVLNDVKVEGKLDGLKISEESLLMVYGNQFIPGRKVVSGNVEVSGSLMVHGLINEVNITELANKAVLRDRTSNITGMKSFKQPLTITSLEAPTVLGVDVVHLQKKLDANFSTSLLEGGLEEIEGVVSHMIQPFKNQAVIFQYYELFQEFELLTVYDWLYVSGSDVGELLLLLEGSSSINKCSSSIKIFGFDKPKDSYDSSDDYYSNSFIPASQELSTSHAVSVKSLALNSTFLFVANKKSDSPCSENFGLDETSIDIYAWLVDSFKKLQSLEMHNIMDIAVFTDESKACLVVLEEDTRIYCNDESNKWITNEILLTRGGQKVSILQSHRTVMAIITDDASYMRANYWERQVDVYFWDSTKKQFGKFPKQVIKSTFTQSVTLTIHKEGTSEEVFLILAEGSIPRIHNKPKIVIYRYDAASGVFQEYQVMEDYGIVESIVLKTGEILIFLVDSLGGQVKVYQHKGVSGFVKIDSIKTSGVTKIYPFVRSDPEDWFNHYLALAGRHSNLQHETQGEFFAKILKSKMKGRHLIF